MHYLQAFNVNKKGKWNCVGSKNVAFSFQGIMGWYSTLWDNLTGVEVIPLFQGRAYVYVLIPIHIDIQVNLV